MQVPHVLFDGGDLQELHLLRRPLPGVVRRHPVVDEHPVGAVREAAGAGVADLHADVERALSVHHRHAECSADVPQRVAGVAAHVEALVVVRPVEVRIPRDGVRPAGRVSDVRLERGRCALVHRVRHGRRLGRVGHGYDDVHLRERRRRPQNAQQQRQETHAKATIHRAPRVGLRRERPPWLLLWRPCLRQASGPRAWTDLGPRYAHWLCKSTAPHRRPARLRGDCNRFFGRFYLRRAVFPVARSGTPDMGSNVCKGRKIGSVLPDPPACDPEIGQALRWTFVISSNSFSYMFRLSRTMFRLATFVAFSLTRSRSSIWWATS